MSYAPPTIISFYPKFSDLDTEGCDKLIETYRAWLDQYGRYGKLYMMHIGKIQDSPETHDNVDQSIITGVKIYDPEIATLFRLMHEI